jgi:4-hydroxy-tetrahydrodipicolinate synthase
MRFEGVFVANVTPFTDEGFVDLPAMRSHLEWLAECGVAGFVPCGTTGEGGVLTRDERLSILKISKEIASKRGLKVIAGCGSNCTETVISLIQEAEHAQCDAALVVTPYYNKPTLRGVRAHYEAIAKKSRLPIILYNVPSRTNVPIPADLAVELLKDPNIVGIKEASSSWSQWLAIAHGTDLTKKALLAGDDDAFSAVLALGGSGTISASANVAPREFVEMFRAFQKQELSAMFHQQIRLYPLTKALFIETNPSPAKYALSVMGKMRPNVRLPLVHVTEETGRIVRTVLAELGLLK